jgi:hypothetical protein
VGATSIVGVVLLWGATECTPKTSQPAVADASPTDATGPLDCVDVLRVPTIRGYLFANVRRFGKNNPHLREEARLADLSGDDRSTFCDWEACVRTNGYNHFCAPNDAGVERCRVCDGGTDCQPFPVNRDDCAAHANDPGRGTCLVGLVQECLIQQGLRGFGDSRLTRTCWLSRQACDGRLAGDLSQRARAAQVETDQVTIQEWNREVELAAKLEPDASEVEDWRKRLSAWEGGLPTDVDDAGDPVDASTGP